MPVHDLKIHPRDHEIIAATHGRGIWIADVAALEQLNDSVFAKNEYLLAPKTAYAFGEAPGADISVRTEHLQGTQRAVRRRHRVSAHERIAEGFGEDRDHEREG